MIERLVVALRFFAEGEAAAATDAGIVRRAAGDYLDAYRLIMDCPQYQLGATARAALVDVEGVAERLGDDGVDPGALRRDLAAARAAAGRALAALGTTPS